MKEIELKLLPEIAYDKEKLNLFISQKFQGKHFLILRRSIDARRKKVLVLVKIQVSEKPISNNTKYQTENLPQVENQAEVIIVGSGPAGLFAALKCIEKGIKPIVLERGKDVQARRIDLANINKKHIVNPESNYCFGEGGAGTYSDGKLYTRSTKRGNVQQILEILVAHGATKNILIDAHPHIGTNKLPKVIQSIRQTIIEHGGEIHFDKKVTDIILKNETILGVKCGRQSIKGIGVILATGHSARDVFELLNNRGVALEAKPFALGLRVEHSQQLIDSRQYSCDNRGKFLPAASYSLKAQIPYKGQRQGVFSFCMCPGGFIVPSATAQNQVVVNGMSPSRRDSKFANSGIVVTIDQNDFQKYSHKGALAGMYLQQEIEEKACLVAGSTQSAPAQLLSDFVRKKISNTLLDTSYQPGLVSADLTEVLPQKVSYVLQEGFKRFGKKINGYLTNEAQVIGVESRTSSPVKIPRNKESHEHIQIKRLYPCAEGAGYAGGIISAAIDGENCAKKLIERYT